MRHPQVSICMITYNHESFIAESIEGILKQETEYHYELIICEDNSTDNTRKVIERYLIANPSILKVCYNESNLGLYNNTKKAIKLCSGKYIAFCDGDDYWHNPEKLQKQIKILESHPEYGLSHSNYNVQTGEKILVNFYESNNIIPAENYAFEQLIRSWCTKTLTVCIRRALLLEAVDDIEKNLNGWIFDMPLFLHISQKTKFHYCPESLATYRIHDNSEVNHGDFYKYYDHIKRNFQIKMYFTNGYRRENDNKFQILKANDLALLSLGIRFNKRKLIRVMLKRIRSRYLIGILYNLLPILKKLKLK